MAAFAWGLGDPFNYEMDDTPFYAAIPTVSSDVFNFAADTRLAMQTTTFGWGVSYTKWYGNFAKEHDPDNLEQNMPLMAMLTFGMIVSYLPWGMVNLAPYSNPYTAPVALALDAYNIYRYFD